MVDARACGAQVICTTSGGTQGVAGPEAVVIEEPKWNFQPLDLYSPPALNFDNKISNKWDIEYEMKSISTKYIKFLESFL